MVKLAKMDGGWRQWRLPAGETRMHEVLLSEGTLVLSSVDLASKGLKKEVLRVRGIGSLMVRLASDPSVEILSKDEADNLLGESIALIGDESPEGRERNNKIDRRLHELELIAPTNGKFVGSFNEGFCFWVVRLDVMKGWANAWAIAWVLPKSEEEGRNELQR